MVKKSLNSRRLNWRNSSGLESSNGQEEADPPGRIKTCSECTVTKRIYFEQSLSHHGQWKARETLLTCPFQTVPIGHTCRFSLCLGFQVQPQ